MFMTKRNTLQPGIFHKSELTQTLPKINLKQNRFTIDQGITCPRNPLGGSLSVYYLMQLSAAEGGCSGLATANRAKKMPLR